MVGILLIIKRLLIIGVVGLVVLLVFLYLFQAKLIYFPRSYSQAALKQAKDLFQTLEYTTSFGKQYAFYYSPSKEHRVVPDQLWVLFNGNASLGLDWIDLVRQVKNERIGVLLLDYPGYGLNQGKPSPQSALESSSNALLALIEHLETDYKNLSNRLNVMGLSLGSAAALQFAAKHPPREAVLLAPFTSMQEMACLNYPPPLCYVLRHKWDNLKQLDQLLRQNPSVKIRVFHGDRDRIIPIRMGKQISELAGSNARFHKISGASHNELFYRVLPELVKIVNSSD